MLLAQFIRNAKVSDACFIATINTSTKFTLALHMSTLVHTYAKVSFAVAKKANTAANFSARNKLATNLFSIK